MIELPPSCIQSLTFITKTLLLSLWKNPCPPTHCGLVNVIYGLSLPKTLFYLTNIILPIMIISFLSVFMFHLPAESKVRTE